MRPSTRLVSVLLPLAALAVGYVIPPAFASDAKSENPLTTLARAPAETPLVHGVVEQRLAAGPYTYLGVRTSERALRWAATMGRGASLGTRVAVRTLAQSEHFHSARLDRDFEDLSFAIVTREESP